MSSIKRLSKLGCNSCTFPVYIATRCIPLQLTSRLLLNLSTNNFTSHIEKRFCGIRAVILISNHLVKFSRQRAYNYLLYLNKLINDLSLLEWLSLNLCRLNSFCTITNLKYGKMTTGMTAVITYTVICHVTDTSLKAEDINLNV